MIGTFQALAVLVLAVLPGGLYTIAREHRGSAYPTGDATGRLIRLVGVSAAMHALLAPITYMTYRALVVPGRLNHGERLSLWWWLVPLTYLAVPFLLGKATARGPSWAGSASRSVRFAGAVVGLYTASSPEPRAWDKVFNRPGVTGWVVVRLAGGEFRAGPWSGSYAAGYPEEQDLYLSDQVRLDPSGLFVLDARGRPELLGRGFLIRWSEVTYLEFID